MTLFVMLIGRLPFAMAADQTDEATEGDGTVECTSAKATGVARGVSQAQIAICETAICDHSLRFPSGECIFTCEHIHAYARMHMHTRVRFPSGARVNVKCFSSGATVTATTTSGDGSVATSVSSVDRLGADDEGDVSLLARALLAVMLIKDPNRRATLASVAQHPWVSRGGAEPLQLPQVDEPLLASPEEVHRAISIRIPELDLAGSHDYRYDRNYHWIASTQSHPPATQAYGGAGAGGSHVVPGIQRLRSI